MTNHDYEGGFEHGYLGLPCATKRWSYACGWRAGRRARATKLEIDARHGRPIPGRFVIAAPAERCSRPGCERPRGPISARKNTLCRVCSRAYDRENKRRRVAEQRREVVA